MKEKKGLASDLLFRVFLSGRENERESLREGEKMSEEIINLTPNRRYATRDEENISTLGKEREYVFRDRERE